MDKRRRRHRPIAAVCTRIIGAMGTQDGVRRRIGCARRYVSCMGHNTMQKWPFAIVVLVLVLASWWSLGAQLAASTTPTPVSQRVVEGTAAALPSKSAQVAQPVAVPQPTIINKPAPPKAAVPVMPAPSAVPAIPQETLSDAPPKLEPKAEVPQDHPAPSVPEQRRDEPLPSVSEPLPSVSEPSPNPLQPVDHALSPPPSTYTVEEGDWLEGILKKLKVRMAPGTAPDLKDLVRWNDLDRRGVLHPGENIYTSSSSRVKSDEECTTSSTTSSEYNSGFHHGRAPLSTACNSVLSTLLKVVLDVLRRHGYVFFVDGSTLLNCHRFGDLARWDWGVLLSVVLPPHGPEAQLLGTRLKEAHDFVATSLEGPDPKYLVFNQQHPELAIHVHPVRYHPWKDAIAQPSTGAWASQSKGIQGVILNTEKRQWSTVANQSPDSETTVSQGSIFPLGCCNILGHAVHRPFGTREHAGAYFESMTGKVNADETVSLVSAPIVQISELADASSVSVVGSTDSLPPPWWEAWSLDVLQLVATRHVVQQRRRQLSQRGCGPSPLEISKQTYVDNDMITSSSALTDLRSQNKLIDELGIMSTFFFGHDRTLPPEFVQGIYISYELLFGKVSVEGGYQGLIRKAASKGVNVLVVDVQPELPPAEFTQLAKNLSLYLVARVVCFPGGISVDNGGLDTLNVTLQPIRTAALRAVQSGFAEVQFDYIRLADEKTSTPSEENRKFRYGVVEKIVAGLKKDLEPVGGLIGIDTFGRTAFNPEDEYIGQKIEILGPYLDALYPMLYPSLFMWEPWISKPYQTIFDGGSNCQRRVPYNCRIIPYIQGWTGGIEPSGLSLPEYVKAQIQGAKDSGCHGWVSWNIDQAYDDTFSGMQMAAY